MKMTVTITPEEIIKLVEADLTKRGFVPVAKAKLLVTNRTESDMRESWTVPEFNGVEVDVEAKGYL